MKRLNFPTQLSKTPLWTNDLKYLQEGISEAFGSILTGLGLEQSDFIISGCKITDNGSRVSMSAGWCYYDGEILPVRAMPATSYSGGSPRIKLTKMANYDHAGDRTISIASSTGTVQLYKNDYLQPSLLEGQSQETYRLAVGKGAWDLGERIVNASKIVDSGVVNVENAGNIRYRMVGGVVQLYGNIRQDAIGSGWHGVVATGLPRPAVVLTLPFSPVNTSERIVVETDGSLSVYTKADTVYFDHVMYLATPVYNSSDGHYSMMAQQPGGGAVL